MKKILGTAIILAAMMLLIPLSAFKEQPKVTEATAIINAEQKTDEPTQSESFKVYDPETEKITEMTAEDYIFGVVAAEMPVLYEEEALKAQAVAAYTFACCRKAENSQKEYDITTSPLTDQSYITEATACERWGKNAEIYTKKIKSVIEQTKGYMITYNGLPATAVYHAISSGKTESCKDVWGKDIPYLVPVTSEGDRLAEGYISEVVLTKRELRQLLKEKTDVNTDDLSFGDAQRTDSGAVKEITLCGETFSGSEIRELVGLRSSNFQVNYSDKRFTFTVYGYGHGVGMSQNGANYMAKQGSTFKEILTHYYTDCKIEKVN